MFVIGVLKNGRRFNIERLLAWGIKTMPPICFDHMQTAEEQKLICMKNHRYFRCDEHIKLDTLSTRENLQILNFCLPQLDDTVCLRK